MIIRSRAYSPEKLCSVMQKDFCNTIGTFETFRDVRSSVAIEGKSDVSRPTHFGSE
jgi:hypothetical protein